MIDLTKLSRLLSVPCKIIEPWKILCFTLHTSGISQTQLFIVPPYTYVPDHNHPDVTIIVTPLSGCARIRRGADIKLIEGRGYGKSHTVKKGVSHGFEVGNEPFIYLSQQIWRAGMEVGSLETNWSDSNDGTFEPRLIHLHD